MENAFSMHFNLCDIQRASLFLSIYIIVYVDLLAFAMYKVYKDLSKLHVHQLTEIIYMSSRWVHGKEKVLFILKQYVTIEMDSISKQVFCVINIYDECNESFANAWITYSRKIHSTQQRKKKNRLRAFFSLG